MRSRRLPAYPLYLVMAGSTAFFFTTYDFITPFYRVLDVGLGPLQLLLLGAALEGAVLLFEVPTGIIADVYSRRASVIIGYAIIGAGLLLEGLFQWFPTIFLAQAVWGIGYTFTSGAREAWLADELGEERLGNVYVRGAQVGSAAAIAGILVSAAIGRVDRTLPIFIGGAGYLLLALLLLLTMPESGFAPVARPQRNTFQGMGDTFRDGLQVVRGRAMLMLIMGLGAIYGLASEGMDRLAEIHILQNFTIPVWDPVIWFALLSLATSFFTIGATELIRRRAQIEDGPTVLRLQIASNLLLIVTVFVFGLVTSFALALGALLAYRLLREANQPLYYAWITRQIEPRVRATVLSMLGQVDAIGQLVGGPIIGLVASLLALRAGIVGVGVLLAPVIPLLLLALRRSRQAAVETVG